jgi:tetratricopeptide (TPR) repeat protein
VKAEPAPERPEPVKTPETVQAPETLKEAEGIKKEEPVSSQADAADYFSLGLSLEELGKFDEAAKAHKHAVRIRPDYAEAYYHLGLSLDNAGRYEEAAEVYRKVLRINPDHAEAHYNLGYSSLMLDDGSSALEEYKTLQKLDPEMAVKLAKNAVKKAETDKNSKYILQLAAFKNINSANDLLKKVRPYYMHAYIERENNFSKVRINGIKTRDELHLMKEEIIRKFKANPYTIELE